MRIRPWWLLPPGRIHPGWWVALGALLWLDHVAGPGCVGLLIALWFARLADFERELRRQVRVLEGLLSICAFCKSIRTPQTSSGDYITRTHFPDGIARIYWRPTLAQCEAVGYL